MYVYDDHKDRTTKTWLNNWKEECKKRIDLEQKLSSLEYLERGEAFDKGVRDRVAKICSFDMDDLEKKLNIALSVHTYTPEGLLDFFKATTKYLEKYKDSPKEYNSMLEIVCSSGAGALSETGSSIFTSAERSIMWLLIDKANREVPLLKSEVFILDILLKKLKRIYIDAHQKELTHPTRKKNKE